MCDHPDEKRRPVLKIARLRELRAIAAGQIVTPAELTEVLDVLEAQSEQYQQWICELEGPTPREMIKIVQKLATSLDEQAAASLREYGVPDRATEHRAEGVRSALRAMRIRVPGMSVDNVDNVDKELASLQAVLSSARGYLSASSAEVAEYRRANLEHEVERHEEEFSVPEPTP
jgi:hypothetical protein